MKRASMDDMVKRQIFVPARNSTPNAQRFGLQPTQSYWVIWLYWPRYEQRSPALSVLSKRHVEPVACLIQTQTNESVGRWNNETSWSYVVFDWLLTAFYKIK